MELLDLIEAYYSPARKKAAEAERPGPIPSSLDFELPVWDDRGTRRTPVSPEALILRSEGFLSYYNGQPNAAQQRLARKCNVEFTL